MTSYCFEIRKAFFEEEKGKTTVNTDDGPITRAEHKAPTAAPVTTPDFAQREDGRPVRAERMSRLRRTIAKRMVDAQQNAALLTTSNEVDMTEIMDIRKVHKEDFLEAHGVKLGIMSFFLKAAAVALKEFGNVNASVEEEHIMYHDFVDIGIAVATPKGLVVPVIRDADQLAFHEIEQSINDYAVRGRNNELTPNDLDAGTFTFTITNGGVFGSMLSTPIVKPPQSGILGMHNIVPRPVAMDGEVVIRPIMYVALTYDHRIIDGAEAVSFLVRIKNLLEQPVRLFLDMR